MAAASKNDEKILSAALEVMGRKPWSEVTLAEIAQAASLTIGAVYSVFPSRLAILCALHRRVDVEMLDGPTEEGPARDRVFDLLMRRFDGLAPLKPAFKTGLANLRKGSLSTLEPGLVAALSLPKSMVLVLEAAGVEGSCLVTKLRAKILGAVYLSVFRVWLDDDSEDLARTMAALDKALGRASSILGFPQAQPQAVPSEQPLSESPIA